MNVLAGKTAIVTGASRGRGRAAALALAQAGAQVIVHYRHGASEAEALAGEIREIGGRSAAIAADLSAPDGPHRLARRVRGIVGERLDILVANAGIGTTAVATATSFEDLSEPFALNVRASYFLVQQLLPILCKGSSVVFLLPPVAHATAERLPADAAINGAVTALTRHFAFALGERGIRVNAVSNRPARDEHGESEGMGSVVTFLASDAARWITGDIVSSRHRHA